MRKAAKYFEKGELFKRFGHFNIIEEIVVERIKVTFKYTSHEGIINWATFKKDTQIETKSK